MLVSERLQDFFIFHRCLDYGDEDATLEEQGVKILYFFSTTVVDLRDQLSLVTLAQAMIELVCKFSKETIQFITMHKKSWSFYECEKDIWFVSSMANETPATRAPSDPLLSLSCYTNFIQNMYSLYFCLNGSIQESILGKDGIGLKTIDHVLLTSKALRKLKKKIEINQSDITRNEDGEEVPNDMDLNSLQESLQSLQDELSEKEALLMKLNDDPFFTLPKLKMKLNSYIQWYFSHQDMNTISCLPTFREFGFESRHHRPAEHNISQLVRMIKQCLPSIVLGCMVSIEGRLLWSDFHDHITENIQNYLARLDNTYGGRNDINQLIRISMEEFCRNAYSEVKSDFTTLLEMTQRDRLVAILKEKEELKKSRIGMFTVGGNLFDVESYSLFINASNSTVDQPDATTETIFSFLDDISLDETIQLISPFIYPKSVGNAQKGSTTPLGRLLTFHVGLYDISVIIPVNQSLHAFGRETIQQMVLTRYEQGSTHTTKMPIVFDQLRAVIDIYNHSGGNQWNTTITTVFGTVDLNKNQHAANDDTEITNEKYPLLQSDIQRIQWLLIIYALQKSIRTEIETFARVGYNNTAINQSLSTFATSIPAAASSSSSAVSSSSAAVGTSNLTSSSSSATAPLQLQGIVNPMTWKSYIQTKYHPEKENKIFILSPLSTAYKGLTVDNDYSLPLFLFSDQNMDPKAAYLEQYFFNQFRFSSRANVFFNGIMNSFGLSACRAIHDLWVELSSGTIITSNKKSSSKSSNSSSSSLTSLHKKLHSVTAMSKNMLCIRVSTEQRGGMWAMGKRLFNGRIILVLISQSSKLYDALEIFEQIIKDIL